MKTPLTTHTRINTNVPVLRVLLGVSETTIAYCISSSLRALPFSRAVIVNYRQLSAYDRRGCIPEEIKLDK